MRHGARSAVGLATACLLVAGCSGDGDGTAATLPPITGTPVATTSDSSASPSAPTTVPTDPVPTTSAQLPDEHVPSAEEFVTAYLGALNDAKDSRDFASFDAMYLSRCTGCLDMRAEVTKWLANGQRVEGGDWVVMQQSSSQLADESRATVFFLMYRTKAVISSSENETVSEIAATPVLLGSAGLATASPWTMEGIGYEEFSS